MAGILSGQRLKIAFIRNPHAPEIAVVFLTIRIVEDGRQRLTGQTPPLRTHMRYEPIWYAAFKPYKTLKLNVFVKKDTMFAPREGEAEREPFLIQPADGPWDVCCGRAFDKIGLWTLREVIDQFTNRAKRKAGSGREIDVPDLRKFIQHDARCRLRRGHKPPCSPFAAVSFAELDVRQIRKRLDERFVGFAGDVCIGVNHDRAPRSGPMTCDLLGPSQRGVDQHDDSDTHRFSAFSLMPSSPSTYARG